MALAPITILDTFSRTVSNGWGTSDSGQIWTSTSTSNTVGSSAGNMASAAGTGLVQTFINFTAVANSIPEQESCEVVVRVQYTGSDLYPSTDFGPILQKQASTDTFYYATLQGSYGEVAVGCYIDGVRWEISRTSFSAAKNVWHWMRFKRLGSNLYLRIWKEGTTEPTSWTITTTTWTGAYPPRAGSAGMFRRGTTSTYNVRVANWYFYTLEDTVSTAPVSDLFNRQTNEGWGVSQSKHPWEGHVSVDPYNLILPKQGNTAATSGGQGIIPIDISGLRLGIIGPSTSGGTEVFAKASISTVVAGSYLKFGIRGKVTQSSGNFQGYGYALQVQGGTNEIKIVRRNTAGGTTTAIATGTMATTMAANIIYSYRFQIDGTTLKGRGWIDGTTEPSTWQVTVIDTTFVNGRAWVETAQTAGTAATAKLTRFTIQAPTPDGAGAVNYTSTGGVFLVSSADTSLTLDATYTNDADADNSAAFAYKLASASTWTTFIGTPTVNRTTKTWQAIITGLAYKSTYNVRVTFSDPDDVHGANPMIGTFNTSGNSVSTKVITATNLTATTADVTVTYDDDADANSTVTLSQRVTTREQIIVEDTFDSDNEVYLQNHFTNNGVAWAKHPLTTTDTQALIRNSRLVATNTNLSDITAYYVNGTSPTSEYDVVADFYTAKLDATIMVMGRFNPTTLTGYGIGYNNAVGQWELRRMNLGVVVVIGTSLQELDLDNIYTVRLIIRNAYKSVEIDGVEIIRSTDNTLTTAWYAGYYATNLIAGSSVNHILIDNFKWSYRTAAGSWTTVGAMSVNRATKTFTKSVTDLVTDTVYDFQATFADSTSVQGSNPIIATAMTIGQAVKLKALGVATQPTAAVIDILYEYDTNNNSNISIQYRSIRNTIWQTILSSDIVATRYTPVKRFTTTLAALRPATTYEVRAIVDDPNGLIEGSARELRGLFTTSGLQAGESRRAKYYLWKVYDPAGRYLSTLTDVPDPKYTFDENGGNTNLNVTLLKRISDIGTGVNAIIAHQNRIDVWVLDPSSEGLGPNIIDNGDMVPSGGWSLGVGASFDLTGGPDGSSSLKFSHTTVNEYETVSNPIELITNVPLTLGAICRSQGARLAMYAKAYNNLDVQLDQSDEIAETVGTDWQQLRVTYTPPVGAVYVRMAFRNRGIGTMYADMADVRAKEMMVYRGNIESYSPKFDNTGESVDVEVLGLVSQLSDDYLEHLQYVRIQSSVDQTLNKQNRGPADPATIFRDVIDYARKTNPRCQLYYTNESINPTGTLIEYTFRDQQLRAIMDKTRELCPPNWHYYIEPDGLVVLRGPEHVTTHILKSNVNIQSLTIERSIRNKKNYIRVKGRQDDDKSELDGFGSINYTAFDQASIDKYGRRVMFIKDTQIATPDVAELYGDGRLEEMNKEELRATVVVPDEKSIETIDSILIGYNIESFKPGDLVRIYDPVAGPRNTYWDQFVWDQESWDVSQHYLPLPDAVPIKSIKIDGVKATLELSQRQPSAVSNYGKLSRWISKQETDSN